MAKIITRFAPSPTGYLHIGGLRTALFSYLYARKNGGEFLLRIEDTDLKRNSEEATRAIIEAFEWVGLEYDGQIEYQSKRFEIYAKFIQKLLDEGKAYRCYMSKDELDALRAKQEAAKERPRYDGRYRDFTGTPPDGISPVIRIKAPQNGEISFIDGVKGEVKFNVADILDDFIIARSDGTPTYNFCVVVDDALMGVSDVIRGDDHLSNTPKQIVLYNALGFAVPKFYHLAMIHGEDGKKLSKRHGATDVMEYKALGFTPQALLNFLVRLGWSHGDDEIFSLNELKSIFDPAHISKSASAYSFKKLEWLNAHYIKTLPFDEIAKQCENLGFSFRELGEICDGNGAKNGENGVLENGANLSGCENGVNLGNGAKNGEICAKNAENAANSCGFENSAKNAEIHAGNGVNSCGFENAEIYAENGVNSCGFWSGEFLLDILRERSKTLLELIAAAKKIVQRPQIYEEKAVTKFINEKSLLLLKKFADLLGDAGNLTLNSAGNLAVNLGNSTENLAENLENLAENSPKTAKDFELLTNAFLERENLALKDIAQALRIALTGSAVSPGIYEVLEFLGTNESKARIAAFLDITRR